MVFMGDYLFSPPDVVRIVGPCQKIVHAVSIISCCKVAVDASSVLSESVLGLPVSNSVRLGKAT